jgi:chemotaxis protein histidine kinase CheA
VLRDGVCERDDSASLAKEKPAKTDAVAPETQTDDAPAVIKINTELTDSELAAVAELVADIDRLTTQRDQHLLVVKETQAELAELKAVLQRLQDTIGGGTTPTSKARD